MPRNNDTTPQNGPLLRVTGLKKYFGDVKAVDDVSFNIARGRCIGLLGPNGAGKTTTVELLEGIKEPTAGEILYKGEILGGKFRQQAGIMFQSTALPDFISCREALELFRDLYPETTPIDELITACALEEYVDREVKKLSGGQRQRLLLAIALINNPEIIFLDEPTTGLDPQARRNFWNLIGEIRHKGKTVLLTTHYMDEAYELCDEIIIMDRGKIIAHGTPDELLSRHFNDTVILLPDEDVPEDFNDSASEILRANGTIELLSGDVNATVAALIQANVSLTHMRVRKRSLEDLFIELTGKELRG